MERSNSRRHGVVTRRAMLRGGTALAACASLARPAEARRLPRPPQTTAAGPFRAEIFPFAAATDRDYPEQSDPRYSAAGGQWGVAFSGGGPRAFAAALGQMRGLRAAGKLDRVGALSCVSGGTWFGSLFTFAPPTYADDDLLGAYVAPEDITVPGLQSLPTAYLGTQLNALSNTNLVLNLALLIGEVYFDEIPNSKVWARVLNAILLKPYGLGDTGTRFTLDAASEARIVAANPGLELLTARPDRPFLIAGATQIYDPAGLVRAAQNVGLPGQVYRSFEYTPLYAGTPQYFAQQGYGGGFGGGYVESFAFDTPAPTVAPTGGVATVPGGAYPFLLSDAVGSSSAAIAAYVQEYLNPILKKEGFDYTVEMAQFDAWPVRDVGTAGAFEYAFGDGGILENTGVVALLRRGYRTIFAFVNTPFPIGDSSDSCVRGIDGQISRLFGFIPKEDYGTDQPTQVFAASQFDLIVEGLSRTSTDKTAPIVSGRFPVLADNPFGIAPYTPQIFWFYNAIDEDWRGRLSAPVSALLASTQADDYLANFPNFATVVQNVSTYDDIPVPEVLYYTPRQINLLAHMWAYTVRRALAVEGEVAGAALLE